MYADERVKVRGKIQNELLPEIKAELPAVLRFVLKAIFPKMTEKILIFIEKTFEWLLIKREMEKENDAN